MKWAMTADRLEHLNLPLGDQFQKRDPSRPTSVRITARKSVHGVNHVNEPPKTSRRLLRYAINLISFLFNSLTYSYLLLSCRKAGKALIFTPVRGPSGESQL